MTSLLPVAELANELLDSFTSRTPQSPGPHVAKQDLSLEWRMQWMECLYDITKSFPLKLWQHQVVLRTMYIFSNVYGKWTKRSWWDSKTKAEASIWRGTGRFHTTSILEDSWRDIAMNIVVTNRTRQPSIAIQNARLSLRFRPQVMSSPPTSKGTSLSSCGIHYPKRTEALNVFVHAFGYTPLIPYHVVQIWWGSIFSSSGGSTQPVNCVR